jgi:hypothetical protein
MRRSALALIGALVATLAGCYGSTEPATDVGIDSATLHGYGTANNGRAESWFEYGPAGYEGPPLTAGAGVWPAGARGPVSAKVTGLAAGSPYSFKLCGRDLNEDGSSGNTICAQTLSFTTKPPIEDSLKGRSYAGCCSQFTVDAASAPDGSNPRGFIRWYRQSSQQPPPAYIFNGFVTCLAVNGSRAAVGAVGKWTHGGEVVGNGTFLVTIVDGRAQEDTYYEVATDGSTLPNCATADFSHQSPLIIREYSFIVNDAQ